MPAYIIYRLFAISSGDKIIFKFIRVTKIDPGN